MELSSFLDVSDIRDNSGLEPLLPRKNDSQAIQNFKKGMLETQIKPKSWRDHKMRIE